jgi:hypothetical protein
MRLARSLHFTMGQRQNAESPSGVHAAHPSIELKEHEMKVRKTLIAAAIAALIPLGAALAGDNDKMSKGPSFDKLDTNHDGRISQAEAAVDSTIVFSQADANGDGYVSKTEWKAATKGSASPAPQSSPQSAPVSPTDPAAPQASEPSSTPQSDTETPRQ